MLKRLSKNSSTAALACSLLALLTLSACLAEDDADPSNPTDGRETPDERERPGPGDNTPDDDNTLAVQVDVSYSGQGGSTNCPVVGNSHSLVGNDKLSFSFEGMKIADPSHPTLAPVRSCRITAALSHTPGWRLRPATAELRGTARLVGDDIGRLALGAKADDLLGPTGGLKLSPPYDEAFYLQIDDPFGHAQWSSCSGTSTLELQLTLSLTGSGDAHDAELTASSLDAYLQWKKCP